MRTLLLITLMTFASGDALASISLGPSAGEPGVASADGELVARRKRRKKKKKKRGKKKRRVNKKRRPRRAAPATPSEPEPLPPMPEATPDEADTAAASEPAAAGGDWMSPSWASSESTTSSTTAEPAEPLEVEETVSRAKRDRDEGVAGAFLVLSPGYSGCGRSFRIEGNTTANVRPYEAKFVSHVGGTVEAYPGILLDLPAAVAGIGLRGTYRQAIGLESATAQNQEERYSTTWNEIDAGLAYKLSLGSTLWVVGVSYGMLNFELGVPDGNPMAEQSHDLGYRYLRAGLDFRLTLGDAAILLGGGYRHVLSSGDLGEDIFPGSSALGFDAFGGAAYQLFDFAEVRLTGRFAGFMHDLESNATYAATGATDFYWGGDASVVVYF